MGDIKEDDLCIMWYDIENDKYILLDKECIRDKENHTISYETDHFSTWLVVDKNAWKNCWKSSFQIFAEMTNDSYDYLEYKLDGIIHRYQ